MKKIVILDALNSINSGHQKTVVVELDTGSSITGHESSVAYLFLTGNVSNDVASVHNKLATKVGFMILNQMVRSL